MTIAFDRLSTFGKDGTVHVVVEAPRSSRAKFSFDPELGGFVYTRPLTLGLRYPFDWGFIPSTLGEDGDPLDGMIIHDVESYPGVVIPCRPIGVLEIRQTQDGETKRNDRFMFAPVKAPRQKNLDGVETLSHALKNELERFFLAAVAGTKKELEFLGWRDHAAALQAIRAGHEEFRKKH